MIYPSAIFQRNQCIPSKVTERKLISAQQRELSCKKGHKSPKFCGSSQISNLTCSFNDITFCKLPMLSMHPYKSAETNINTTQQKLSRKKGVTRPNFCEDNQYQSWPVFYNDISFCKLSMKSIHPCKSYWAETNIDTATKTKSKNGHFSVKIMQMITNIELDLYFTMIYPSANFWWYRYIPSKHIERKPIT